MTLLETEASTDKATDFALDIPALRRGRPFAERSLLAERCAWSLVWFGILTQGLALWEHWWGDAFAGAVAPLLVLVGIVGIAATWWVPSPRAGWLQRAALACALGALAIPEGVLIQLRFRYATDAAAFDQLAASALVRGHNPYTMNMAGAAQLLADPVRLWTYTVDGRHVTNVSYPAGAFLADVPAYALGLRHLPVDWMDLGAWLVTGVLVFALLPASLRWFAGLILAIPIFAGIFSSGGTDALFMPFLVLALWRWDRFGDPNGGLARWIGPISLGVACSIKQLPWFCVPFLVLGLIIQARRNGVPAAGLSMRYLAIVAGTFVVINAPFIVWDPLAWVRGVVTPLDTAMVANGQGLVSLALHGITGGVDLTDLSIGAGLAICALVVAYARWFTQLKRIWLFLVPLVFFVAPRSLSTYIIDLFPAAVVAAVSVARAPQRREPASLRWPRCGEIATAALAIGVMISCAVAFMVRPLDLRVLSTTVGPPIAQTDETATLASITVRVENTTSATVAPNFMVLTGNNPEGFWRQADGAPVVLAPHTAATVTLVSPTTTRVPLSGAHWLVWAYTSAPRALSTSTLLTWHH
jgi:hypothetical protein